MSSFAKICSREIFEILSFTKISSREMTKKFIRENKFSRKLIPLSYTKIITHINPIFITFWLSAFCLGGFSFNSKDLACVASSGLT